MWKEYITRPGIKSDYFRQDLAYFNPEQTRISRVFRILKSRVKKKLRGSYGKSMVFGTQALLGQIWPQLYDREHIK